jgi:hypothetical protein
MTDVHIITEADLTIEHGHPDERWAGTPIDSWRGYQPMPSVVTALEAAIVRPGVTMIAYVHELPDDPYRLTDKHQMRAARAWVAEHHPHLKVATGTEVLPFRGVGSDCRVFKVTVGAERRRAAAS